MPLFLMGLVANLNNSFAFLISTIILRFLIGVGDVFLQITSYSLICQYYTNDITKQIGYSEITSSLSNAIGPAVSVFIFSYKGYQVTNYLFGLVGLFGFGVSYLFIPDRLNTTNNV